MSKNIEKRNDEQDILGKQVKRSNARVHARVVDVRPSDWTRIRVEQRHYEHGRVVLWKVFRLDLVLRPEAEINLQE